MRTLNPRFRGVTTNRLQSRSRAQLVADGVVASYIHDISSRHHDEGASQHRGELPLPRIRRVRNGEHSFRGRLATPQLDAA